jgi:hypothetical protein
LVNLMTPLHSSNAVTSELSTTGISTRWNIIRHHLQVLTLILHKTQSCRCDLLNLDTANRTKQSCSNEMFRSPKRCKYYFKLTHKTVVYSILTWYECELKNTWMPESNTYSPKKLLG